MYLGKCRCCHLDIAKFSFLRLSTLIFLDFFTMHLSFDLESKTFEPKSANSNNFKIAINIPTRLRIGL